jgi:ParB family chromosome partitioning protein
MTTTAPPELAKTDAARNALDLRMILIEEIAADPNQPRKTFDAAAIDELGQSLKQGQTNAIKVRARGADEDFPPEIKWVLMHGERRLRAARKAEIPRLRAEVAWDVGHRDTDVILLDQIADNLHDVDLGAVEEAAAIRRYAELSKLGTREVAAKLGKKAGYVSWALGMNKMPAALVKRIEENARGTPDVEPYALTWKHLRHLLRLTDYPEELERAYDDAFMDRSAAREVERAVSWTLEEIERERQRVERAEAAAKKIEAVPVGTMDSNPTGTVHATVSLGRLDEKRKQEALEAARMTRARKDLIRGAVPEIVAQVNAIEQGIQMPEGLALSVAGRISGYDVTTSRRASTGYSENIASLVVPDLPGKWSKVKLGSATNAGRWAEDDEAGRQWLAFTYWLATETKGMDADLDRQSRDVLKARDQQVSKAEATRAGWLTKAKTTKAAKAAPTWSNALVCARDDCSNVFHIKLGHKGRRPKYCDFHRSR